MTDHSICRGKVNAHRIADDLWRLVNIPSPTGHEQEAAIAYAGMLQEAGARVELHKVSAASPAVIGRLQGRRLGKIFQLAGHLDHIDVPHAAPSRDGTVISGRGSADMKSGLAGMLEVVRVLHETGSDFPGEILITAYGDHEAPAGNSSALRSLIERGLVGDAALVAESADVTEGKVIVAGAGQAIWNIAVRRTGPSCHELQRPDQSDHLLEVVLALARALREHAASLPRRVTVLLRPESLFLGQLHYGDFYNRAPDVCTLQGTRRWHPASNFAEVQAELGALLDAISLPAGISIESRWDLVGEAYEISPEEPIVSAYCEAVEYIVGRRPVPSGTSIVTDANRLVQIGRVPTVHVGFDCAAAHAGHEFVRVERLLAPCQVALQTALNYLHYDG